MRGGAKEIEDDTQKRLAIPITVRQLEAIIRIAESLAKMEFLPFALERHVDEALRLFQVGTFTTRYSTYFIPGTKPGSRKKNSLWRIYVPML